MICACAGASELGLSLVVNARAKAFQKFGFKRHRAFRFRRRDASRRTLDRSPISTHIPSILHPRGGKAVLAAML
jgi:hypothetical protein